MSIIRTGIDYVSNRFNEVFNGFNNNLVKQGFIQFKNSSYQSQDLPHDLILRGLLDNEFKNDTSKKLQVIRKDHLNNERLNHPLRWIPSTDNPNDLRNNELFVRDYCQYRGSGGFDGGHIIIGSLDKDIPLEISDGILETQFVKKFNLYVEAINKLIINANEKDYKLVREFEGMAHRDAIQLIPHNKNTDLNANGDIYDNEQGIGEILSYLTVQNTKITSNGQLQGIFASDGSFKNLHILNNDVSTKGAHHITISGMLNGKIQGNNVNDGKIKLEPLRIDSGAIYILGFQNMSMDSVELEFYDYEHIKGSDRYIDNRSIIPINTNRRYWTNVYMPELQQQYENTKMAIGEIKKNSTLSDREQKELILIEWESLRIICQAEIVKPYKNYKELLEDIDSLSELQNNIAFSSLEGISDEKEVATDISIDQIANIEGESNELELFIDSLGLNYFSGSELTPYWNKIKNGVYNSIPPKHLWDNIIETLIVLDRFRDILHSPVIIISSYRSLKYNFETGGLNNSLHTSFNAIDFTSNKSNPIEWAGIFETIRGEVFNNPKTGEDFTFNGGLGINTKQHFMHIDSRETRTDWGK